MGWVGIRWKVLWKSDDFPTQENFLSPQLPQLMSWYSFRKKNDDSNGLLHWAEDGRISKKWKRDNNGK
jgi:hypothetical protein